MSARASIIFRQLSIQSIRQLSVHLHDLTSTYCASSGNTIKSVNLLYVRETILKLSALSVNFRQLAVHPQDLPSTFCVSAEIFVNFHQLSVRPQDIPSIFHASVGPSKNVLYTTGPSVNFSQLSARSQDFL